MTPNATHATHQPAPAEAAESDLPAVIVALETVSELADLVHRHRLAIARLRQRLDELADERALREARAVLAAEGASALQRKAFVTLKLAADGDYQALRRRERDLKRELLERQADIERARVRIRLTLLMLPVAEAVDAFSGPEAAAAEGEAGEKGSRPGEAAEG